MHREFTIKFEPNGRGGLTVQVPEIGATLDIAGTTPADAQRAGLNAITAHLAALKRRTRPHRPHAASA